jgi:hypothetical protein
MPASAWRLFQWRNGMENPPGGKTPAVFEQPAEERQFIR